MFRSQFKRQLALIALIFLTVSGIAVSSERIRREDLKPAREGMPGEELMEREIDFGAGIRLTARIEVTAKGNGVLDIGGRQIKVFDTHDDGAYYENGLLRIEFADIDGDNKMEMVLSGIVCFTDDKVEKVQKREAIVFIYRLQDNRKLVMAYENTDFRIE